MKNYECVDVQHDLESCGGCVHGDALNGDTSGVGQDCSQIVGVDTVRCVQGRCVIGETAPIFFVPSDPSHVRHSTDKCAWGYAISADKSHCRSVYGKYY